uniref:FAD-binding domain-containing protein n=1 Tax=Bionectria ochroleuca TaxID=29856 RepID=A0A0B7KI81_BIOOC
MTESRLHAIVVSSGLAGLAAASVLRIYHNVTVYERGSPDIATGGQGIVLYPNGIKILNSVGFDGSRAGGVPCHGYRMLDKDGKLLEDIPIDFRGRWGADMLMMKRSDFRDELMQPGIKGEPAQLLFNTSVIDLDPEAGTVSLADGSVVKGDVIIVADGIHSTLRKRITKTEGHAAKKTGLTLFRVAVSTTDAQEAVGSLPE